MKMLIVDDSSVIRRKIERITELGEITGFCSAGNGREAVEVFRTERPELVTMDLTMPEMDGVACVRELVRIDPRVTILVVSALADKATAIEAIKCGAKGFLCKPFDDAQLNAALVEVLKH
jgi:two-component system chemotaxis response regulator CheY